MGSCPHACPVHDWSRVWVCQHVLPALPWHSHWCSWQRFWDYPTLPLEHLCQDVLMYPHVASVCPHSPWELHMASPWYLQEHDGCSHTLEGMNEWMSTQSSMCPLLHLHGTEFHWVWPKVSYTEPHASVSLSAKWSSVEHSNPSERDVCVCVCMCTGFMFLNIADLYIFSHEIKVNYLGINY